MDVKVEQRRDRRNRRELDARKGKEGESEREAAEIRARRGNEKIPGSREWGTKWGELERTGRKEGEGRKAKGEETSRQRDPSGPGDVYPGDPGP